MKKLKTDEMLMRAACLIQNGIVCIILFLYQNIVGKVFMESCEEILVHTYDDYVTIKMWK